MLLTAALVCFLLLTAAQIWPMWVGLLQPRRLEHVAPAGNDAALPGISVIVPARDEGAAIEAALRTLLALDYPRLEIIAIDDRSRDATGSIMDRIAADDSRCRVVHVTELPANGLGKNHANQLGADRATGDYLLFTDGDVMFAPDVLRRAIAHVQRDQLDHLTVIPDTLAVTFGEQMVMNYFIVQFAAATRMWLARFKWAKRAFVGIGAFNLVSRAAYQAIGGHQSLRMEVADDMMLGKLLKDAEFRSDVLGGTSLLRVKWQTGLTGVVKGLEKNAFAGARYSVSLVLVATLIHLALAYLPTTLLVLHYMHVWPLSAAQLSLTVAAWLVITASHVCVALRSGYNAFAGLVYPVAAIVFSYILLASTVVTLRAGGVRWRDTFYPLAELRAGMIEWHPLGGFRRARRRTVRTDQGGGAAAR